MQWEKSHFQWQSGKCLECAEFVFVDWLNHSSSLGSHVFVLDLHQRQSRCHKAHAHNVRQAFYHFQLGHRTKTHLHVATLISYDCAVSSCRPEILDGDARCPTTISFHSGVIEHEASVSCNNIAKNRALRWPAVRYIMAPSGMRMLLL